MKKLVIYLILLTSALVSVAAAFTWDDLWLNRNEQAYRALINDDAKQAALLFTDPSWQGVAYYRLGDYAQALRAFNNSNDAISYYNRGNALAHLGQYQQAITAYNHALVLDENLDDAKFNRDLLKNILQMQHGTDHATVMPPYKQRYEEHKQEETEKKEITEQNTSTTDGAVTAPKPVSPTTADPVEKDKATTSDPATTAATVSDQAIPATVAASSTPEQALQNIDDDPGELLQRKLLRDYQRQQQGS